MYKFISILKNNKVTLVNSIESGPLFGCVWCGDFVFLVVFGVRGGSWRWRGCQPGRNRLCRRGYRSGILPTPNSPPKSHTRLICRH